MHVGQPCRAARALEPSAPLRSALRLRGRRGGTRPCGTGRLAGRIVHTPTITRDAQPERPEGVFNAKTHRGVRYTGLWVNLPPLTLFAHPPVGCSHRDSPPLLHDPRHAKGSRNQAMCGRARAPQALPPHPDFHTITILSNIHTVVAASPAPMRVGRVSNCRRGGRAATRIGEPTPPRPSSPCTAVRP
jgi:hypothetical protein